MSIYVIVSDDGERIWHADDSGHAREQHLDAFGESDPIREVRLAVRCEYGDRA